MEVKLAPAKRGPKRADGDLSILVTVTVLTLSPGRHISDYPTHAENAVLGLAFPRKRKPLQLVSRQGNTKEDGADHML